MVDIQQPSCRKLPENPVMAANI